MRGRGSWGLALNEMGNSEYTGNEGGSGGYFLPSRKRNAFSTPTLPCLKEKKIFLFIFIY